MRMTQLEFEFRVYRTLEPGGKRECVVARTVPHALQVWSESKYAHSRSLELVISGEWLMQLLEQNSGCEDSGISDGARVEIARLCIQGLSTDDTSQHQECLERILAVLGYDQDALLVGGEEEP